MHLKSFHVFLVFLLVGGSALSRAADAPNAIESRLRESVRGLTLQLRTAQADLATAQAAQAVLAEEKAGLTAQLETLRRHVETDKMTADKTLGEMKLKLAADEAELAEQREMLEKLRDELQKATEMAAAAEAKAAKFEAASVVSERRAAELKTKNLSLFITANKILEKYEDFSLGKALVAKEPFVGTTRVRLENLLQEYRDQIDDQRASP